MALATAILIASTSCSTRGTGTKKRRVESAIDIYLLPPELLVVLIAEPPSFQYKPFR